MDACVAVSSVFLKKKCAVCMVAPHVPLPVSRDAGVKAIENLMQRRGAFDYVVLETTGLADPGPIAGMFWMDEALCSRVQLDGATVGSFLCQSEPLG